MALNLFKDNVFSSNVKLSVVNLKLLSNQPLLLTGDLHRITDLIKHGKGSLRAIITHTFFSKKIKQVVVKSEKICDTAAIIKGKLAQIISKIK